MVAKITPQIAEHEGYKFGFNDNDNAVYKYRTEKGLSEDIVREISRVKEEQPWMTEFRVKSYHHFLEKPMPTGFWGGNIQNYPLDFQDIYYFARASDRAETDWSDVPEYIKDTFDKLGIPEAEKKSLIAGVGAQYDSEVVYHSIREDLEKLGVIFVDMDSAVRDYPDIVKQYFGTIVPPADNKFAALNSAVWSGGSFVYVPAGVKVDIPLQAYFRINKENMGQFERTLIIAEEGSYVHYVEGCTAPTYSTDSLHSAVVEIVVKKGARVRYTTIQNWSTNVYNLVTKRAAAYEDAVMEWVDGNLGSRLTMKYPSVYLMGPRAHGEVLSLAMASDGQHQDAGAKMVHAAPDTTSTIISKSVSRGSGRTSYRGALKVYPGAHHSKATVRCDALLLDEKSRSDTYPLMDIEEEQVNIGHEASVSRVGEDQLFYLQSRGISEVEATKMIVNGFVEPIVKELPMEYAVELNRLIELQMEGAVG
jgi:Fe-S cluster assembly protein SufB